MFQKLGRRICLEYGEHRDSVHEEEVGPAGPFPTERLWMTFGWLSAILIGKLDTMKRGDACGEPKQARNVIVNDHYCPLRLKRESAGVSGQARTGT